jgi:HlyD family secretion protein
MRQKIRGIFISPVFLMAATLLIHIGSCNSDNTLVLSGIIESTQIDINAEVPGKIISLYKEEGEAVKEGDVIALVDPGMQELIVAMQQEVVKIKEAHLEELLQGSRLQQIEQAQIAVETAQTDYEYWEDKLKRYKILYDSGSMPESDFLDIEHKVLLSRQQLEQAQANLDLLVEGSTDQTIQMAKSDLETAKITLQQVQLTLDKHQLRAPVDGILIIRNINQGDFINIGSSIGTISDLTDLWLHVYIPQKYLGEIILNQTVALTSPVYQDEEIVGKIIAIASEAEFTPKNIQTQEARDNTVFKVKVEIIKGLPVLKPGMSLDVIIPLS